MCKARSEQQRNKQLLMTWRVREFQLNSKNVIQVWERERMLLNSSHDSSGKSRAMNDINGPRLKQFQLRFIFFSFLRFICRRKINTKKIFSTMKWEKIINFLSRWFFLPSFVVVVYMKWERTSSSSFWDQWNFTLTQKIFFHISKILVRVKRARFRRNSSQKSKGIPKWIFFYS